MIFITKWKQSTLFLELKTWETMLSTVQYSIEIVPTQTSSSWSFPSILLNSFTRYKQHCIYFVPYMFESVLSTTNSPISFLQNTRLTSMRLYCRWDNILSKSFTRRQPWTLSILSNSEEATPVQSYLLEVHLYRAFQELARICIMLGPYRFLKTAEILRRMDPWLHRSYSRVTVIKAESLDILRQLFWNRNCMINFNLFQYCIIQ